MATGKIVRLALGLLWSFGLLACPPLAVPAAHAAAPDFVIVAGGPTGGLFSIVAAAAAELLRKQFPQAVVDVVPGGAGPNLIQAEQKKITMGVTFANNAVDAWHGRDPAKADKPIRGVRALMVVFPSAIQAWVPADSPITSFKELIGKKVCPSSPGQAPWQAFHNLLDSYGFSRKDMEQAGGRLIQLTWSESLNAFANGNLDSVFWLTLYPHSSMVEVEVNRPVRVLSLEDDRMEAFLKKYGAGFTRVTIPAGAYRGQKEPAVTLGTVGYFAAPASLDEDVAYQIVKTLWSNLDDLKRSHVSVGFVTRETVARGMAIPLHPGALKFYREQGIPVSEPEVQ